MYPTLSNKSKLQEIQEKLKEAELNDNKKDTEKYKKQLKEIEQQVIITGSLFFTATSIPVTFLGLITGVESCQEVDFFTEAI